MAEGLITLPSSHNAAETLSRFESELAVKGVTIFARVDHAANAAAVGMEMPPTYLLVFGSAKAGTPLMQAALTIGIDLPLKALIWQDAPGKTWLSYNDPAWLARRHGLGAASGSVVTGMATLLAALAKAATA